MLELTFFDGKNEPEVISVSENCYERLAKIGFAKKVDYKERTLTIEEEEYSISAVKLTETNRKVLLDLIECERQKELEKVFDHMDDNPTIKEMRETLFYIKELTMVYKYLKLDSNLYFSYE